MSSSIHVTSGDAYGASGSDDRRLLIAVVDPAGVAVDLTGVDLTFVVKRGSTTLISKVTPSQIALATQTGATTGKAYITLAEGDTEDMSGRYLWELEADDAVGKITLAAGNFYVNADLIEG